MLISNPLKYAPSERVCSQPVSNGDGFKARLIIVPHLPELVAVLHLAPPERWTSQWNCSNLRVTVSISKAKDPEWKISRSRVEQVCKERPVTGVFRGLLKCTEMLGGETSNIFFFTPKIWGRFSPNLTFAYLFRWVETTNQDDWRAWMVRWKRSSSSLRRDQWSTIFRSQNRYFARVACGRSPSSCGIRNACTLIVGSWWVNLSTSEKC